MTNIGIFGPGSSSSNPVYQEVACSEVSTNICFIVSGNSTVDNCFTETVYQNICTLVTIASDCSCNDNGYSIIENSVEVEVEGTTLTVYYKIKQLKDICPPTPPQPSSSCDIGDYWITKSGDDLIVEYEYSIIEDYGDYVDITKATSSTTVACNNAGCKIEALSPTPTIDDDGNYHYPGSGGRISFSTSEETGELSATTVCSDKPIIFKYNCEAGTEICEGVSYYIKSITFSPSYVGNDGGTVTPTVVYERVEKNPDCSEIKTTGVLKPDPITIPACDDSEINCCNDQYVDISLFSLTESLTDGDLYYNGRKVTTDISIPYLERAKTEGCGSDTCKYVTTYRVYCNSVDVLYETSYKSDEWRPNGKVPSYGGRIKVTWDYDKVETPTNNTCPENVKKFSDYTIIDIPACTINTQSSTETFSGVILYKVQTPNCKCPDTEEETECPYEEVGGVKMNKIEYSGVQECECIPSTTIEIERVEFTGANKVEKCVECVKGSPKVTITNHNVNGTCEDEIIEDTSERTFCFGVNTTNEARTLQDDYFLVEQEAGPCSEKKCFCGTFNFISMPPNSQGCTDSSIKYTFPEVHIGCGYTNRVTIPYYGVCNGIVEVSGNLIWEDEFICTGNGPTTHTYTFPADGGKPWDGKTITVIQCEDGTCDCDCE